MLSEQFYSNLERWAKVNPKAAVLLPYINTDHLTFCCTDQNEINLKYQTAEKQYLFHSQSFAVNESQKWFASLNIKDKEAIFIYGVGLGYDYFSIKPWLTENQDRKLVFIEDDLAVIHRFFETQNAHALLEDSQVLLFYAEQLDDPEISLSELYWFTLTPKILITSLRAYAKGKQPILTELTQKLLYNAEFYTNYLDEYLSYGIAYYRNFYPNMVCLNEAYSGESLFGKFNNIPAIICGAGPSLNKQLPILTNLKHKALIFAGGSALNALQFAGILPHFGAGIDPNSEQLERLSNVNTHLPFFYRNRMYHPALKLVKGQKLYITGSGGYDTSKWYEEQLGLNNEEEIDEGHNIVNFCLAIAHKLGCNPILFVGLDLALTDQKEYADGVTSSNKPQLQQIVERKDIFGNPIQTLWKWISESQWIHRFAQENPELKIINCTEAGLGIPEIPNIPFTEAIQKHLQTDFLLDELLEKEIKQSKLNISKEDLQNLTVELQNSLKKADECLGIVIQENQQILEEIKKSKQVPEILQSGKSALAEYDLANEPSYSYVLQIFNAAYTKVLTRNITLIQNEKLPEWERTIKKIELNNKRLQFLQDTAKVNVEIIQKALEGNFLNT